MRLLLLFLLCAPVWARPTVQEVFDNWLAQDRLRAAHVGFLLVRVADGQVLASHDADKLFVPASTAKVMTAKAVLEAGELKPLRTSVWRVSAVNDQDWAAADLSPPPTVGEVLMLVGDQDPELSSAQLIGLAGQLTERGVRQVSRLLVYSPLSDSEPPLGRGWAWDDTPEDYSAVIAGLTVDRGTAKVTLVPQQLGQRPLVIAPAGVEISNQATTDTGDKWELVRAPGTAGTLLSGLVPTGRPIHLQMAVPDPERFTGLQLAQLLESRGVAVAEVVGPQPARLLRRRLQEVDKLAEHISRPIEAILREALARSDNLAMELLIRVATGKPAPPAPPTARLVDGSGLSRYNLLSPRHLVEALRSSARLRDLMPLAGVEGTLKNRLKGLAYRQVRAKTGTVSTVSGLAGTLFPDEPDKACVFALLTNGFTGPGRELKQAEDALVEELVRRLAYPYLPAEP